jgi:hypothetical protein
MTEMRQVRLSEELCAAVEAKFGNKFGQKSGNKFGNVEELLVFVLQDLLRDDVAQSETEQRMVEERLRELGYL